MLPVQSLLAFQHQFVLTFLFSSSVVHCVLKVPKKILVSCMNMTYSAWVCDDESKRMRMYMQLVWPYLACHSVTNWSCWKKTQEKMRKKSKNEVHLAVIYPWNTHDTMVWVHGMLQCAKTQHHTCTHDTHDPITVGFPVPMSNPMGMGVPGYANWYNWPVGPLW